MGRLVRKIIEEAKPVLEITFSAHHFQKFSLPNFLTIKP
jgi:hypothetical protein